MAKAKPTAADLDAPGPIPEANLPGHEQAAVPDKPLVPPDPYRMHHDAAGEDHGVDLLLDADELPESVRHPFRFDRLVRPFALAVGVKEGSAWVEITDDRLHVQFGPWSLDTPLDNVEGVEVSGPYQLHEVAGPPHLSLRDRGVTFGTTRQLGACIRFREPVSGLLPFGVKLHPGATVTVADPHRFAADLNERLAP